MHKNILAPLAAGARSQTVTVPRVGMRPGFRAPEAADYCARYSALNARVAARPAGV